MFLHVAKVAGKSVKAVIYHMFYILNILNTCLQMYNQGISVYNPSPCIFATKACMNLILVPMDIGISLL